MAVKLEVSPTLRVAGHEYRAPHEFKLQSTICINPYEFLSYYYM